MSDTDGFLELCNRFVDYRKQLWKAEAEVEETKMKLKEASEQIKTMAAEMPVPIEWPLRIGGVRISMKRYLFANKMKGKTKLDVCEVLEHLGLHDLVTTNEKTYNANRLKSWIREQLEEPEATLPPELEGVVSVFEEFRIEGNRI